MERKKDNIILIGFMGSGKTSVGRTLARITGRTFLDIDEKIESEQKRAIRDIFAREGEAYFRQLETAALSALMEEEGCVISAGGGLPLRQENRRLMKKLGTVIFLQADIETLADRLREDHTRPMLAGGHDRKERIQELMEAREGIYLEAADVCLRTDKLTLEEAARSCALLAGDKMGLEMP